PRGPVYLTLPREVLAAPMEEMAFQSGPRQDIPTFYPDPEKIKAAADLLIKARFPLVITSSVGRSPKAVRALVDLAETGGMEVIPFCPEYMSFPPDHPCHQGFEPGPFFEKADVILVVDCDVPWHPNLKKPKDSAKIIQAGIDPLYSAYPMRSFPSDVTIQGEPAAVLSELARSIKAHPERDQATIDARMAALNQAHDGMVRGWQESALETANDTPLDNQWISQNVGRILDDNTVVVEEAIMTGLNRAAGLPGNYFCMSHAGYLGWCMGAALGIKLGRPESTVIATVGDGSYMFGVPSACHFVSKSYNLPILIIIYNNQSYFAVKRATRGLHPNGVAVRKEVFPLSELKPAGDYEKICEAFGGYGERVESPDQVAPALERALHAVKKEGRQAVLNMICKHA
ncbi:MAG: hypothetical protein JRJ51_23355, partial [Deltaproteobacteria bacterium]|nr:hypothetical protein [Deltaproteobacteria bacterium]